jgi:hypothetical protein
MRQHSHDPTTLADENSAKRIRNCTDFVDSAAGLKPSPG